jgi:hypothetical protein
MNQSWAWCRTDLSLNAPVSPAGPPLTPQGEDLDLRMGWDRFEKLVLELAEGSLGLRGTKFRRYGVQGQAQHGIDLAGHDADRNYTVIQCKEYQTFATADLRAAVDDFASGERPFGASNFIVVTSALAQSTQIQDELAALKDIHSDLTLDLWDSVELNRLLRYRADIVARFWSRETAEVFCTGAPLPGVPAPAPDRQNLAERILVGPLNNPDVRAPLRQAERVKAEDPATAARLYGEVAVLLGEEGFHGHALLLRRRQLESLTEAGLTDDAAELAAGLAVLALQTGDSDSARIFADTLAKLSKDSFGKDSTARRHARLITAAVNHLRHPLGDIEGLRAALEASDPSPHRPALALLLGESLLTFQPEQLRDTAPLISAALNDLDQFPAMAGLLPTSTDEHAIRLRLLLAEGDENERSELARLAHRHSVPGRLAALIEAREARRCCLSSRPEDAIDFWLAAVNDGILAGLTDDAANWLYAIRGVNVMFGPWTDLLDEEHRLAQALRATGDGSFLARVRAPKEAAMSALVADRPRVAVLAARLWLLDSVVTGDWADEGTALEFLADLYRDNNEPGLAAVLYQRAGKADKVQALAGKVGDVLLPTWTFLDEPWWTSHTRARLIAAQADLLPDEMVNPSFDEFLQLAKLGRAGELTDSVNGSLTLQATKCACALAHRTSPERAGALLELLRADVERGPGQFHHTDQEHVKACLEIAIAHPSLAVQALSRLFDLAEQNVDEALRLLAGEEIRAFLKLSPWPESVPTPELSDQDLATLRARAVKLGEAEGFLSDTLRIELAHDALMKERSEAASTRIIGRATPSPDRADFGTRLISDSFLVSHLDVETQDTCLRKLLDIAEDTGEVASTRQEALIAARNLTLGRLSNATRDAFERSRPFVLGERDGSHLDGEVTGPPHPLSFLRVNLGTASLRGPGLRLAAAAAPSDDAAAWVRDQAVALLSDNEQADLQAAAQVLNSLPMSITGSVDPAFLASHKHVGVRQVGATFAARAPLRHRETALRLARDTDHRVRRVLAEAFRTASADDATVGEVLELLAADSRHSVRKATFRPPAE